MKIDLKTSLYFSFAKTPGNFGNRFHNFYFQKYNINAIYKSCAVESIHKALDAVKTLNASGCAVTRPFKESVLDHVTSKSSEVEEIQSCNTVLNVNGKLYAHNTDWKAVYHSIKYLDPSTKVLLIGSGGAARACVYALKKLSFSNIIIFSRNKNTMNLIINHFKSEKFSISKDLFELHEAELIINATPLSELTSVMSLTTMKSLKTVINFPINLDSDFKNYCLNQKINYVSGWDLTIIQAKEQFFLYTNIDISIDEIIKNREHYD